ncbi:MAG: OmpA family protein [Geminicoccaceae bacterium]|nr:MAG: OmpA family protein [Geminicoccaceae bacterium]
MARHRRDTRLQSEIWPGFVDALSTLLMVFIFLLSVFVVAQFFLSQLLAGRDERLQAVERQLMATEGELEDERLRLDDLRRTLARLGADLGLVRAERDAAEADVAALRGERDDLAGRLQRLTRDNLALERTLADVRADAATLARERALIVQALREAEARITADQATIEAQLDDLVRLRQDVAALTALRDRLEAEVAGVVAAREDLLAELGSLRDQNLALVDQLATAEERTLLVQADLDRELARARDAIEEVHILTANLIETRGALARLETLLAEREAVIEAQDVRLDDLDTRLTAALASQVDELLQFRSEFFGRLRQVLGEREEVRIEGDRFVFQSEVLFAPGAATLGAEARADLSSLADALTELSAALPQDVPWILQVDGHTDRTPIATARFPSNWELSAARAISVAQYLQSRGIPPERLAAAGFAEYQPLDPADTEEAYRRNRRIELKITTR